MFRLQTSVSDVSTSVQVELVRLYMYVCLYIKADLCTFTNIYRDPSTQTHQLEYSTDFINIEPLVKLPMVIDKRLAEFKAEPYSSFGVKAFPKRPGILYASPLMKTFQSLILIYRL